MTPAELAALHARSIRTPAPFSEADFLTLLIAPGVFVTGDLRGFALGRVAADEAELLTIAVDPGFRRQGIGAARLAAFEAEARHRGAVTAFLEVAETNDAARALYAAAGWSKVGQRRGYYATADGGRIDALVLSKPLTR